MKKIMVSLMLLSPLTSIAQDTAGLSPLTKLYLAYPKQPRLEERTAALAPYKDPLDSLEAILEDELDQGADLINYPDRIPDSFVVWARDDRQVTLEQFLDRLYQDMAAWDSLAYEYAKFKVIYSRRYMLQPEMMAMPQGMDYMGRCERQNRELISQLMREVIRRWPNRANTLIGAATHN